MKPIGRIYFNESCISGYIVVGNSCIKFGIPVTNAEDEKDAWIYNSKEQRKQDGY